MGLISNLKKAVSKSEAPKAHALKFPSVIDQQVRPADVTKDFSQKIATKPMELKPFNQEISNAPKELPELPGNGFFIHLYGELKSGNISRDDISVKDLLMEMEEFWNNDESLMKHRSQSDQTKWMIERSMAELMERLNKLEQQWKADKVKLEGLNREIESIEEEIASESLRFKELVKKLKFHQEVEPDQFFKLFSGREIKSLNELMGALKIMDDDSFKKHVTATRNDFASWVDQVLKEKDIALQMRGIRDRNSLIEFLERSLSHVPSS